MPQVTPYDYSHLCSEFLKKLLPIFGPDATILTIASIPEIQLNPNGAIRALTGDPQMIFEKMVDAFSELSPFVVDKVTHDLHVEHETRNQESVVSK